MKKTIASFFIGFFILALTISQPVFAKVVPDDTYYGNEWYLAKIKADLAWDKISSSPDIVIAVIDSGIDITHPDLKDNIWVNTKEIAGNGLDDDHNGFIDDVNGWDFVNNVPDPAPKFSTGWTEAGVSHGTMVAGIIAARGNNGMGATGVTWAAKIMSLKALNDKGEGKVNDVVRAIDYAVNNGADIINLSFVSFNYNDALQEAIARARQAGVLIVAAAGNEQSGGAGYDIDTTPIYPACYDGQLGENMVIGVAATDALDQKAKFSSYGFHCVDLTAPGISFYNATTRGSDPTNPGRLYDGYWSGTSMATPLVSGALALIEQANPALSQREVVNILFAATDNISRLNPDYLGQLGNGRLNISRAVDLAKQQLYSYVGRILVLPVRGDKELRLTAANGDLVKKISSASSTDFKSGSSITSADINGDGVQEIIIGSPAGTQPLIKIYNTDGKLLKQFLAFDKSFRGGINITTSDLDNDDNPEIIAVAASNGNGQVRIFNSDGKLKRQFSVDSKYWRGGLSIAAGNLDGRGNPEIVVGYGSGSKPQIKIFTSSGKLISAFLAYETNFRGGVRVAVGNLNGRKDHGKEQIIAVPGKGRDPQVKIFDDHAVLKKQFLAYNHNWQGGMSVAAGDLNNDGIAEIITGALPGAAPHVRMFDGSGTLIESFYAWEESFNGGANVGIIKMNN